MATTQLTRQNARATGPCTQAAVVVRSHGMRWAVAGIAVAVLVADQVTKSLAVAGSISQTAQPGWLSVSLASNHGATGGVGIGSPILITLIVLTVTALAAAFAVRATSRTAAICLAAVVGGALGNLADRLLRSPGLGGGGVVDWIHLSFADGRGATLNIADLAVLLGVIGATTAMVIAHKHTAPASKPAQVAIAAI